jgi:hypothetical protein
MRATVAESDIERLLRDTLFFHVNGSEISLSALGRHIYVSRRGMYLSIMAAVHLLK